MTLQLAMLGAVRFERDGVPITGFVSAKAQALLCYLAVTGREQRRDTLAGLFWGDKAEADAKLSLRVALSNLRQVVGEHVVTSRESAEVSHAGAYWLDVEQFESGARRHGSEFTEADVEALARAAELYRGDFLDGFFVRDAPAFEEWALAQRTRLRNLQLQVLFLLAAQHAEHQDFAQAIEYTNRSLALEPWQEEAHYRLMQWYAESGQRSAALAQYETCRRMLASEFNVRPAEATTALYRRIREE